MIVTKFFNKYREAYRHVWNTYFCAEGRPHSEDFEIFEPIVIALFERIVMTELDPLGKMPISEFIECIRLVGTSNGLPLLVNRTGDGGYWDHPVTELVHDDYEIKFISYFDWDEYGYKDGRYILGRIVRSKLHPEISGHKVLIESQYLEIMYEKSAQQGDAPESGSNE